MLRPVLERVFHLSEQHTSVRTEVAAGLTTFLTMAYIIFVQPTVLSAAGMDFGAVLVATCLSSAFATLLMGLTANYLLADAVGTIVGAGLGTSTVTAYIESSTGVSRPDRPGERRHRLLVFSRSSCSPSSG